MAQWTVGSTAFFGTTSRAPYILVDPQTLDPGPVGVCQLGIQNDKTTSFD